MEALGFTLISRTLCVEYIRVMDNHRTDECCDFMDSLLLLSLEKPRVIVNQLPSLQLYHVPTVNMGGIMVCLVLLFRRAAQKPPRANPGYAPEYDLGVGP